VIGVSEVGFASVSSSHLRHPDIPARVEIPGMKHMEGRTDPSKVPGSLFYQPVDLELEDGRRWRCFIKPDGGIENSGGISQA
jgi:hypothetical protein